MNWRPENWKNPESGKPDLYYGRSVIRTSEIFEAGADAMLKAIEQQCDHCHRVVEILMRNQK